MIVNNRDQQLSYTWLDDYTRQYTTRNYDTLPLQAEWLTPDHRGSIVTTHLAHQALDLMPMFTAADR